MIPAASLIVLVCILATAWITYDRVTKLLGTKDTVAHTWQVKSSLESAYGGVATAESDVRAYMLSKDERSRDRFLRSRRRVDASIVEARRLTRDNPLQKTLLDRLEAAIDLRYGIMEVTLRTREQHDLVSALALLRQRFKLKQGLRAMDDVRSAIKATNAEENRLLRKRLGRSESQTTQAIFSSVLSIAISVVLISAFGLLASRLVHQREEAAEEERSLRADIQSEVERTRAAERRLKATMLELQRSNEELQNFAFVASHDLQEPLRKIRAFSDRVRRRSGATLDDESKDSLMRVEAAADRMQRLILDLLELSRVTTKSRPRVLLDLGQVIDEIADDLQTRLEETGGRIEHGTMPQVVADAVQVRQLLLNLIANALKFRAPGVAPIVRVSAQARPDGRVQIELSDNGIGFEEKYAERIFVVFQRLHGRSEYEGSGIGLAIVRKIVERHKGTIEAEGRPGEGATFRFDLPGEASESTEDAKLEDAGPE